MITSRTAVLLAMACLFPGRGIGSDSGPPGSPSFFLSAAPGDTMPMGLNWGSAARATSYRVTVVASATNGTWAGLPNGTTASTTRLTWTASAVPWDSVTFTGTVESVDALGPTGKTAVGTMKLRKRAGAPGPVTFDTVTNIGTLVLPPSNSIQLGQVRTVCAVKQYSTGAIAQFTADKVACDSLYQRLVPAGARVLVTPAIQAHTDSLTKTCVTWNWDALYLSAVPKTCSAALNVTAIGVTGMATLSPFRPASAKGIVVSTNGLVTCILPGVYVVRAFADNGKSGASTVNCMDPHPIFYTYADALPPRRGG